MEITEGREGWSRSATERCRSERGTKVGPARALGPHASARRDGAAPPVARRLSAAGGSPQPRPPPPTCPLRRRRRAHLPTSPPPPESSSHTNCGSSRTLTPRSWRAIPRWAPPRPWRTSTATASRTSSSPTPPRPARTTSTATTATFTFIDVAGRPAWPPATTPPTPRPTRSGSTTTTTAGPISSSSASARTSSSTMRAAAGFREVTREAAGLDRYANAITAVAFDYDRDGRVDLFVGDYFQPVNIFKPAHAALLPRELRDREQRRRRDALAQRRAGPRAVTFSDVTKQAGFALAGWTLDLGHGDADNDGDDDLYVACDFGTDRFFVNNGDGTFTDRTAEAIGDRHEEGDERRVGRLRQRRLARHLRHQHHRRLHARGQLPLAQQRAGPVRRLRFTDVARETGTHDTGWGWGASSSTTTTTAGSTSTWSTAGCRPGPRAMCPTSSRWSCAREKACDFADARNWPPMGKKSLSGYQKKKLFHNQGGSSSRTRRRATASTRRATAAASRWPTSTTTAGSTCSSPTPTPSPTSTATPLRRSAGHWAALRAARGRNPTAKPSARRLRLTAGGRTLLRFVDGGNGFAAQSSRRVHFGLGKRRAVDELEVLWPSGRRQTFSRPRRPTASIRIVEGTTRHCHRVRQR